MREPLITTKITPHALHLLRLIAATTSELQYETMTRLLETEAEKLGISTRRL